MNWTNVKLLALLPLASLLSGCLYGQCIDGPCALERERMIKSIKPYLAYWQKEGMTEEGRRRDSLECGGLNDSIQFMGTRVLKAAQRPGETDEETETRLRQDWVACMREKGYQWVKSSSPPSRPRSR